MRSDESGRAVQAAIDAELKLLDPGVRASRALVSDLLEPESVEFGASGRRWDATSILVVTSAGSVDPESPVKGSEMSGHLLAPGVVHLTYFADNSGRRAWRSSLWRLTETGWRLFPPTGTVRPPRRGVSGHEIDHVSMEAAMGSGPAAAAQPKVLVVDDQADNLLAMTAVLDWRR